MINFLQENQSKFEMNDLVWVYFGRHTLKKKKKIKMKLKIDFQKRLFKRFWGNNTVYSDSPSNTFRVNLLFIKMNDPTSSSWGATRTFRPNFRANRANHAKMRKNHEICALISGGFLRHRQKISSNSGQKTWKNSRFLTENVHDFADVIRRKKPGPTTPLFMPTHTAQNLVIWAI